MRRILQTASTTFHKSCHVLQTTALDSVHLNLQNRCPWFTLHITSPMASKCLEMEMQIYVLLRFKIEAIASECVDDF